MCDHLRDNDMLTPPACPENCSAAALRRRRHCRPGKCRALQYGGGAPCQDGTCAHKAGLLGDDPRVVRQLEFVSERLDVGCPIRCRPGKCRSLARRGLICVPGQCVAKLKTVHSAERLHEFVETHAFNDRAGGRVLEQMALLRANQAASAETLERRGVQAVRVARQQWDYVAHNNPSAFNDAWLKERQRRRARKEKQKQKKRLAEQRETQTASLYSTSSGV